MARNSDCAQAGGTKMKNLSALIILSCLLTFSVPTNADGLQCEDALRQVVLVDISATMDPRDQGRSQRVGILETVDSVLNVTAQSGTENRICLMVMGFGVESVPIMQTERFRSNEAVVDWAGLLEDAARVQTNFGMANDRRTEIGEALQSALEFFIEHDTDSRGTNRLLLITDGEMDADRANRSAGAAMGPEERNEWRRLQSNPSSPIPRLRAYGVEFTAVVFDDELAPGSSPNVRVTKLENSLDQSPMSGAINRMLDVSHGVTNEGPLAMVALGQLFDIKRIVPVHRTSLRELANALAPDLLEIGSIQTDPATSEVTIFGDDSNITLTDPAGRLAVFVYRDGHFRSPDDTSSLKTRSLATGKQVEVNVRERNARFVEQEGAALLPRQALLGNWTVTYPEGTLRAYKPGLERYLPNAKFLLTFTLKLRDNASAQIRSSVVSKLRENTAYLEAQMQRVDKTEFPQPMRFEMQQIIESSNSELIATFSTPVFAPSALTKYQISELNIVDENSRPQAVAHKPFVFEVVEGAFISGPIQIPKQSNRRWSCADYCGEDHINRNLQSLNEADVEAYKYPAYDQPRLFFTLPEFDDQITEVRLQEPRSGWSKTLELGAFNLLNGWVEVPKNYGNRILLLRVKLSRTEEVFVLRTEEHPLEATLEIEVGDKPPVVISADRRTEVPVPWKEPIEARGHFYLNDLFVENGEVETHIYRSDETGLNLVGQYEVDQANEQDRDGYTKFMFNWRPDNPEATFFQVLTGAVDGTSDYQITLRILLEQKVIGTEVIEDVDRDIRLVPECNFKCMVVYIVVAVVVLIAALTLWYWQRPPPPEVQRRVSNLRIDVADQMGGSRSTSNLGVPENKVKGDLIVIRPKSVISTNRLKNLWTRLLLWNGLKERFSRPVEKEDGHSIDDIVLARLQLIEEQDQYKLQILHPVDGQISYWHLENPLDRTEELDQTSNAFSFDDLAFPQCIVFDTRDGEFRLTISAVDQEEK